MNKTGIIGIVASIVIGLGIISFILMGSSENQEDVLLENDLVLDELISLESESDMEPTRTGNDISVEFTESVGLKSP